MAKEYWNQPQATAASFTPDGWFKTGDLGHKDSEGFIYIVDRVKDIIIREGENIPSIDVENAILKHPHMSECAAVAIKHPALGEEVSVLVAVKPGETLSEQELHEHVARELKPMWRLRFILVKSEEIVKNANGKLDKKIIRTIVQDAWDQRNAEKPKSKL